MTKSDQLQIRVTPRQKATLRRLARDAGQDVSAYVLSRALPDTGVRFRQILRALAISDDHRYPLAELNDLLAGMISGQVADAVATLPPEFADLSLLLRNYVAAMVEQTCHQHRAAPPSWTAEVEPLPMPYFATTLANLRFYLLQASPVAYKRRNIFVDSGVGARV